MAFSTETWGGWDYMPRAWPRWIDATDGVLLVGAVGSDGALDAEGAALPAGTVVAVVRLAMPAAGEGWLEGIRVDPRVRAMDVATDLQVAELHWAAANGARIVRYATSARNEGSMRLGARGGFELIARFEGIAWEPSLPESDDETGRRRSGFLPEVQAEARLRRHDLVDRLASAGLVARSSQFDGLWAIVSADLSFTEGQRLYEPRPWALEELTRDKFAAHLARGEVIVRSKNEKSVAIIVKDIAPAEEAAVRLALMCGAAGAAFELMEQVRSTTEAPVRFRFALGAPVASGFEDRYRSAGYETSEWPLHILARPLDEAHPVPPVDPAALILADQPGAVITPAQ